MDTQEFEQIDINSFLDHTTEDADSADNNGAFTDRQNDLINQLLDYTKENDNEYNSNIIFNDRVKYLSIIINKYYLIYFYIN